MSEEIKEGRGSLGALLKDKDLYSNLTKMVSSSQRLLISVEKAVNNIELASQLFPDVINKAESSMLEINKSAEKMPYLFSERKELISNIKSSSNEFNKVIRDSQKQIMKVSEILRDFKVASAELPDVIKASQENIDEITRIVEGAEKNWIIKGLIERKKKEEPIIVDVRDAHYDEIIRE